MKFIPLTMVLAFAMAGCAKTLPDSSDASVQDAGKPKEDAPAPTQTCRGAIRCITELGCYSMLCAGDCIDGLDAKTLKAIQELMTCTKDRCDGISQWETSLMALCVYSECRKEIEPCTNTGPDNCVSTLTCAQNCALDGVCLVDCLDEASYEARLLALTVTACIEEDCPDALNNPTKTLDCVIYGPCHEEYQDCLDQI